MKRKVFMLLALALAALFVGQAYADSAGIISLGEGNYTSLGDKIINLTGSDGQTIINAINIIPEGGVIILKGDFNIYDVVLTINKPLTIKSNTALRVNGSTLKGAHKPGPLRDRGIKCQAKGIVLENLNITGGSTGDGGGLDINNCSIDIINCKIFGNASVNLGGGIGIQGTSSLRMVNCEVSGNSALGGGGGIASLSGHPTIEMINCKVTRNVSGRAGGGLYLVDATAKAINCNISGNTPNDIYGTITIDGKVYSSEYSDDTKDSGSGGGCDAAGLGLMAAAIAFTLWRKR